MSRRLNQTEFIEKVKQRHGNRYVLDKAVYVDIKTPVIVICAKHDYEFEVTPNVLLGYKNKNKALNVGSCPICLKEYLGTKTHRQNVQLNKKRKRNKNTLFVFKDDKKYYPCETHGDVLVGNTRKFNAGCPTCNIENFETLLKTGKRVVDKKRPVHKSQIPKLSYEDAKERVNRLGIISHKEYRAWIKRTNQVDMPSNPERVYIGKGWVSSYEFFDIDMSAGMSGGEKKIYLYLKRKNIRFEYEKKFDGCKNIHCLRFDFYLPDYNLCVEFDGDQHFRPSSFSSDSEVNMKKFRQTQINDGIKNKYCRDNGINLLRLDNHEFDNNTIEWTLDLELTSIAAEIAVADS